jgi:antitoxin component YwqK of YwqJK toxin-antitoxin module
MYFFPNGRLFYKTYYRHDQKVGPCVSYYESGIVAQTCSLHLKNGKRDGLFNSYYSNGNVLTKQLWRNGRLQKIFTYRDESGQELPIGDFKDGNGSWLLQKDGKVVYVLTYKNGKLIQEGSAGSFVPFSQR